ncbi:terminase small subunit [Roseomonas sp. BN140053]|uniref:terminase small subunit n=1 Tax=Roseomonas sp. BN140053 TaxID=3391898 RepID=UPI0039ED60A7
MALTAKKRRFVEEYLADLNASAAAIRAGYSAASAKQIGSRLMQEADVAAALAEAMAERSRRTHVSADRVVRELASIAFADIRDTVTWGPGGIVIRDADDISDDAAAALVEVSETTQGHRELRGLRSGSCPG